MGHQPLDGISVVELTTMIAGPYAGQMLGDLGADVVKIERPGSGELARNLEPKVNGTCFYYLTSNRNKRSLALDVTTPEGQEIYFDLVREADVVIENFHPSFTQKYEIGYEHVREHNERLIYCSISAFGNSGPYQSYPGIDTTIQAMTGGMSMTRTEQTEPMRSGVPLNDVLAANHALNGILLGLYDRERTGEGQFVDISLFDVGLAALSTRAQYSFTTDEPYPPFGRRHNYFAPEGAYEVSDGEVQISVVSDRHWQRFCEALETPALATDDRFETVNDRVANSDTLDAALAEVLSEWTGDDLVDALRDIGVPAAPVHDTISVWEDPQANAREMRQTVDHPQAGTVDVLGFPVKYSSFEQRVDRHPPLLGEHTGEILQTLGRDPEDIATLEEDDVVGLSESE